MNPEKRLVALILYLNLDEAFHNMYISWNDALQMAPKDGKGPFEYEYEVAWVDTDAMGIMHFSNYFRLCERAEQYYLGSKDIKAEGIFLPRVHATCDYTYPLRFRQKARVEVTIKDTGKRHITFEYHIFNQTAGKLSAKCNIVVAAVNANMEPVVLEDKIVEKLKG